jgi:hypothetical protein
VKPLEAIVAALNARMSNVLQVAEAALPPPQFQAFRKIALDQFGRSGFQRDVEKALLERQDRDGTGRPIDAMKGGAT